MGLHKCPKCKQRWVCLIHECEYEGKELTCPICTAKELDCHPFSRIKYKGAFAEWEKSEK